MTAPDPLAGLDPVRAPRGRGTSRAPSVVLGVVVLLALVTLVTSGVGGAFVLLGLAAVVVGALRLRRRRHPSGHPGGHEGRHGGAVLVAGIAALALGGALSPSPPTTTVADTPSATTPPTASSTAPVTTTATTSTPAPTTDPVAGAADGTALAALGTLAVKGRAPRTGYDRDLFGSGFVDVDRNGCDTRNDVLDRDLGPDLQIKPGTQGCVALAGTLQDPYTGQRIAFTRDAATSPVQVDHVVALSDAWQKGAQAWDETTRVAFANDPLELLAVDASANTSKSDGDAATWLPPNTDYRCAYVARQVTVKAKYGLWVTDAERAATAAVLTRCPDQPTTSGAEAAGNRAVRQQAQVTADRAAASRSAASSQAQRAAAAQTAQQQAAQQSAAQQQAAVAATTTEAPSGGSTYYKNCTAVRAAGAAPIFAGQPGYSRKLDRDGDGVACE